LGNVLQGRNIPSAKKTDHAENKLKIFWIRILATKLLGCYKAGKSYRYIKTLILIRKLQWLNALHYCRIFFWKLLAEGHL
jgi:hypothetical protein